MMEPACPDPGKAIIADPVRTAAQAGEVTAVGTNTLRLAGQVVRLRGVTECANCAGRALAGCEAGGTGLVAMVPGQRTN